MTSPHARPRHSTPTQSSIIEVSGVSQSFTVGDETTQVLRDITFKIKEKSFNILYGPSGSGKSTVLNILTGLQKPTSGDVNFQGLRLYNLTPDKLAHFRANKIGIVYQQNYWVNSLNVIENVSIPLFFLGYSRAQAHKRAREVLALVDMEKYETKYPTLLSGGEQQRIAMARALVNDPLFIIADEPTGSLDSKNGDKIMELLQRFQSEYGRTIILVSHNMEYIPLADHLLHIEDGHITETQDDEDIASTAAALINALKVRIVKLRKARHG